MANPQPEDGWYKLVHEVDASVACADFTKGARIVLREVFYQIYGPIKRRLAKLSPSAIARVSGLDKSNVAREIRGLIGDGVLERREGGYRFLKNYELWTRPVGPSPKRGHKDTRVRVRRLSEREAAYCDENRIRAIKLSKEVRDRKEKRRKIGNTESLSDQTTTLSIQTTKLSDQTTTEVVYSDHKTLSDQTTKSTLPPDPPLCSDKKEEGEFPSPFSISQRQREPSDLAAVNEAVALLAAHIQTNHIAIEIGRNHHTQELIGLVGWKWVAAARKLTDGTLDSSKAGSWKYYLGIVKGMRDEEHPSRAKPKSRRPEPQEPSGPAYIKVIPLIDDTVLDWSGTKKTPSNLHEFFKK